MNHTWTGIKPSTECELQIFNWRYKILQQHFVDVATVKILSLRTADETGFSVVFEKVGLLFLFSLKRRLLNIQDHLWNLKFFHFCSLQRTCTVSSIFLFSLCCPYQNNRGLFFNRIQGILNYYAGRFFFFSN